MGFMRIVSFKNYFLVRKSVIEIFWGWGKMCGVCVCTFSKNVYNLKAYMRKFEFIFKSVPGMSNTHYLNVKFEDNP